MKPGIILYFWFEVHPAFLYPLSILSRTKSKIYSDRTENIVVKGGNASCFSTDVF